MSEIKEHSESISQLTTALASFQADMPDIRLDSTVKVITKAGGSYNFKYATFANILKQSLPLLAKQGLSITQIFRAGSLVTILFHKSGEWIESTIPIDLTIGTMQEIGSRISYLKRYSFTAIVGAIGDEDDDGNIADGKTIIKPSIQTPQAKSTHAPIQTQGKTQDPACSIIQGVISTVEIKTGEKNGKPWTKYDIHVGDKIYVTFDKELGDAAQILEGASAIITYEQKGKFLTCTGVKPIEEIIEGCTENPTSCDHSKFSDLGRAFCSDNGPACKYQTFEDAEGDLL